MNNYPVIKASVTISKFIAVFIGASIGVLGTINGAMVDDPLEVFASIVGGGAACFVLWVGAELVEMVRDATMALTAIDGRSKKRGGK